MSSAWALILSTRGQSAFRARSLGSPTNRLNRPTKSLYPRPLSATGRGDSVLRKELAHRAASVNAVDRIADQRRQGKRLSTNTLERAHERDAVGEHKLRQV